MKPICLIIPPSPFLLDERVFPSLGILKVAAVLRKAGVPVDVIDLSGVSNFCSVLADYLRPIYYDGATRFFGVTSTTPQFPAATKIAGLIRTMVPGAQIILGGPHGTLSYAAWKREVRGGVTDGRAKRAIGEIARYFDRVVCGDGEMSIFYAIEERAPRIIDADDPAGGLFMDDSFYNSSPTPARDLIDLDSYHYKIGGARATSLISQLGCPFGCQFCGGRHSPSLRRIRKREPKEVLSEIRSLFGRYKYRGYMFYDDELNVNKGMLELMEGLVRFQDELNERFHLRGFIKAELFTSEQAEAMKRAGFDWILVGFESGSDRILKNINKRATRADNDRCLEIARRYDIKVKALMSLGHAGETWKTAEETERWLKSRRPDDFDMTIITPFPGSPYFDDARRSKLYPDAWEFETEGDRLYSYTVDYTERAAYYKGDPDDGYVSYVFTDDLTAKEIIQIRDGIERNVRAELGIPFNPSSAARSYEISMGQLPAHILREARPVKLQMAREK